MGRGFRPDNELTEFQMPITLQREGKRVYFNGDTYAAKDQIKAMGGHWDTNRRAWWVGSAKLADAEKLANAEIAPQAKDLSKSRVYAKVKYKGRQYYVIAEAHNVGLARLTVLDGSLDFWADMSACEVVKAYHPREYRGHTTYTTLGGIKAFIESQKGAEQRGEQACCECGKFGKLHHDLEDGGMKCYNCCDIPE